MSIYIDKQIVALRELHQETLGLDRSAISILDFLTCQAVTLNEAHAQGNLTVIFHLACWCRPLIGQSDEEIMDHPLTLELVKESVAREHGFSNWAEVENLGDTVFDKEFEQTVDLVLSGKASALAERLAESPHLIGQTSQYGHAATLLHYIGANGVESHRQMVPLNALSIVTVLVKAGADVNAEANMYGGGSRVLGLLMTSAHPHNAGVIEPLRQYLTKAGAH